MVPFAQRVVLGGIFLAYVFFLAAPLIAPYPKIGRTDLAAYLMLGLFVVSVVLHVVATVQARSWPFGFGAVLSVALLFALLIRALSVVTGDSL